MGAGSREIPVRFEFALRTPMITPTTGKHLDALLSWAAVQQADFMGVADPISAQHDTGLAKHHVSGRWCFKASLLAFEWLGEPDQIHYIKRSRLDDYAGAWDAGLFRQKPYFDGARGSTKAGSYLQPLRWVKSVLAYGMVDDLVRVKELLPWVTHIGKLSHKDFGAVREVDVCEDATAESRWVERNLPIDSPYAGHHIPSIGALSSPYWQRENFAEIGVFDGC